MARPGKKRKVLFVLEIVVLLLFIGGLYVYGQIVTKLDKIETPVLDQTSIEINPEAPKMTGYKTYALFGIDHRDKNSELGGENSDTIIVASVNNDTKDVKLVSIYRDTLLYIGDDTYSKANAAYAYGGPEQAITMLNTNLDLNIDAYATVDFNALTTVIDELGGLDIPMSYAEIEHMNNYCVETSEETGKSYTPIEKPEPAPEDQEAIIGTYHLNGVQATSYCRIRYTASLDMGRTERQRRVIQMIVDKAKKAGITTIFNIMDQVFPMVTTSLNKTEILEMLPTLIGYSVDDTTGFPQQYKFSNIKGSIIVPTTLESNVVEVHKFLYGEQNYTPTQQIVERSQKIIEIVGGDEVLLEEAPVTTEEQDNNDSFTWSGNDNGDGNSGGGDYDPGYDGGGNYDPGNGGG
ncbi:MAG: LCP family protein, partial [Eubacteriales bacterium]|nr:LCP family protein [Eubacteriales bacterium]